MHNHYKAIKEQLRGEPARWLVTGVAGSIGSNLLEQLWMLGQELVGLDNVATGYQHNLDSVRQAVGSQAWRGLDATIHLYLAATLRTESTNLRRAS